MRSPVSLRIFDLAAALLLPMALLAGMPGQATAAQAPILVPLEPVGGSGIRGTATIAPEPTGAPPTSLTLEAEGLQPEASYLVHVHAGTPARPSASFGLLGILAADADGRAQLRTTTMTVSAGPPVALSLDLLADGDHFVEIHDPALAVVAVGQIPSGGPTGPTGIAGVDAAIGAVLAGDADRLAAWARMRELPCGPDTPEGFAMTPPCEPGEAEGTPVAILPAAACEVYWPRDPRPVLQDFVRQAGPLYAVLRAPADRPANLLFPTSEYLAVFEPRPGSHVFGLALYIEGESVVAVEAGCRGPRDLMHFDGVPLEMVWGPADGRAQ